MSVLKSLRSIPQKLGLPRIPDKFEVKPPKVYTPTDRIAQWDYVNSVYNSPERDVKNFPNLVQPDSTPPVRLGIIPASWFDFLYPKTGATGPYLLGGGFWLWMLSKEIMVVDHYFWEIPSFTLAIWFIIYKWGPQIRKYVDDQLKLKEQILYTRPITSLKTETEKDIMQSERLIEETETASHLYKAKKEMVGLQLEAAYRLRLLSAYKEVKKRLDYESEKENLRKKFEQEHMTNWIVSNVTKNITKKLEEQSIKTCIKRLKELAAKESDHSAQPSSAKPA